MRESDWGRRRPGTRGNGPFTAARSPTCPLERKCLDPRSQRELLSQSSAGGGPEVTGDYVTFKGGHKLTGTRDRLVRRR